MSHYALLLMIAGFIPFCCSFYPALKFYRHSRALFSSIGLVLLIFGSWDIFAAWRGHWYFHPAGVWRFRVINLPIEEILFFIVIPFCCIFTWEAMQYIKHRLK